jgi:hypothetical protein
MKKILTILLVLLNSGCIVLVGEYQEQEIDQDLLHYVEIFEIETDRKVKSSVSFGMLDDNIKGLCRRVQNDRNEVIIDYEFWETSTYEERNSLMAHELLHCEFGLEHVDQQDNHGVGNLMSPFVENSIDCVETRGLGTCINIALGLE